MHRYRYRYLRTNHPGVGKARGSTRTGLTGGKRLEQRGVAQKRAVELRRGNGVWRQHGSLGAGSGPLVRMSDCQTGLVSFARVNVCAWDTPMRWGGGEVCEMRDASKRWGSTGKWLLATE